MLLAFIKEKFSRHGRRGRGVGTRGICELQNQKVISKTLNTSAINVHSPGGAGPATACPSARKQQEDSTTPAEGQLGMGIHLAEHTRRKTQQQTRIWYGDILWLGPYQGTHSIFTLNPHAVLPPLPPAARGRAWLARQLGHVPDASKQSSLVRATFLQHPQRRRYGIKSFVKWSIQQGQMEMQTKSKVSNEHLSVMQQAQRNSRSLVAPPVHTSHLSPGPSFLEGEWSVKTSLIFLPLLQDNSLQKASRGPSRKKWALVCPSTNCQPLLELHTPPLGWSKAPRASAKPSPALGAGYGFYPQGVLNPRSDPSAFLHRQIQIQINIQTLAQNTVLAWPASRCESGLGTRCLGSSAATSEESL